MAKDNPLNNPEVFREWKEHRLTKALLDHLKDRVEDLTRLWVSEESPSDRMLPEQVRAGLLADLVDLECNDVRRFYGLGAAE